jgi:hypothetical protein
MSDALTFPRMLRLRQRLPRSQPVDLPAVLASDLQLKGLNLRRNARIAIGVGSRGITDIADITRAVVNEVRKAGLSAFVIPAMGSHGGATPEGQSTILADYGVTEASVGVPIEPSMTVSNLGQTADGIQVWTSQAALAADGIILINRVKPHTDFLGELGSGLVKMSVVGLGKREGAVTFHAAAGRLGHLAALRSIASVTLSKLPIVAGIAILEGFHHETTRVVVLSREEILDHEPRLVEEARSMLPRLPFDDIDLLIVDRIGKDISGTGMDANVTGRYVHGYLSSLAQLAPPVPAAADGSPRQLPNEPASAGQPTIRRILVRDLTPGTRGNAIGIGMADFTTTRLVRGMDAHATYTNAITALSVQAAKVPIHFESDRETLLHAMATLGVADLTQARVVRIADTLSLMDVQVSEAYETLARDRGDLEVLSRPEAMRFEAQGNLAPMTAEGSAEDGER